MAGYTSYFYWVSQTAADALFGSGVTLSVTIKWNGVTDQLYLNNVLVQSFSYSPVVPNWTAASNLDVGAYEYLTYGGYYVSDDIIDEFTVMTLPSNQPPPSSPSHPRRTEPRLTARSQLLRMRPRRRASPGSSSSWTAPI